MAENLSYYCIKNCDSKFKGDETSLFFVELSLERSFVKLVDWV